jgi:hypothetical protein
MYVLRRSTDVNVKRLGTDTNDSPEHISVCNGHYRGSNLVAYLSNFSFHLFKIWGFESRSSLQNFKEFQVLISLYVSVLVSNK